MRIVALFLAMSLVACADSHHTEERLYTDPILGTSEVMTVTQVHGWEITQARDVPSKFLVLGQTGRPIVSILGDGPRRSLFIEGKRIGSDQVAIEIAEDHSITEISFFSDGVLYKLRNDGEEWVLDQHRRSSEP